MVSSRVRERNHIPFRNWCKHRVFGKGKSNPHRMSDREDLEKPRLHWDYMYLNEKRKDDESRTAVVEGEGFTIVVMVDSMSKGILAYAVPQKGECEYAIRKGAQYVNKILGYHSMVFKAVQEPALKSMMERIGTLCGDQVVFEESPIGESQGNGEIENAVGRVQGQFRAMRSDLESSYNKKVPDSHVALAWLVMHASMTMMRYAVGSDGMTAYKRIKGRNFRRDEVNFGECI